MKARHAFGITIVAVAALLLAGCGNGDDSSSTTESTSDTSTSQSADDDSHAEDDGTHDGPPESPIRIESPTTFQSVHGEFELAGTAQVHEGALRWAILGEDLKPIATGSTEATCGAPCRGDYSTRIPLAKVPAGSWELHVWQPPVADGDPERVHDTIVPITVTSGPVDPDEPTADQSPPGGALDG